MAHYADQIAHLPLLNTLRGSAGRADVSPAEVELLAAMVSDTAETIGPLLARIPLTFRQYTEHDIRHSANLIRLMGRFIPAATLERLNAVELAILALAALLHDSGMFVTDTEKEAALASAEYRRFEAGQGERAALLVRTREAGEHLRAATLQDALLAEFFRRIHPERAAAVVKRHLMGKLMFRDVDLTPAVLRVCESHGWGVLESNDPRDARKAVRELSTRKPVSSVPVNEQYLACCLRLADIMDFDRSRTPASVFQHLGFTEAKSWEEWNKHLQVRGWHVDEHEVMYAAPCTHPAFYVAVMEFLDWIDAELRDCRQLVKEAPAGIAERYELHLPPVVDRRQVEMEDPSYLAGAFRFQLDYERIMQLLMDRSLYPDPSLFLRELLQNALDACRTREAHAKANGWPYEARIAVWDHSDDPHDPRIVFQDNGIGMSRRIVENYFLRVGRSYYKSAEFDLERQRLAEAGVQLEATSQFGIGILSCFMVADRFDVETYRTGSQPLRISIEGPTKYFTIQLLPEPERTDFPLRPATDAGDGPPNHTGTRVTVHLRPGADFNAFDVLDRFAVNVDFPIIVQRGSASKTIEPWRSDQLSVCLSHDAFGFDDPTFPLDVFDKIFGASIASFQDFDFCSHLRGKFWVWLLRGETGVPSPVSGNLELLRSSVRCRGFPVLMENLAFESTFDLSVLNQSLSRWRETNNHELMPWEFAGSPKEQRALKKLNSDFWIALGSDPSADHVDELIAYLQTLSNSMPSGRYDISHRFRLTPWWSNGDVVMDLHHGGQQWAKHRVRFTDPLMLGRSSQMALHGIALPAGVVQWQPMEGMARRVDLVPRGWGVHVDLRGNSLPTPAASRLSISESDAESVCVPILRAVTRHALSLATRESRVISVNWHNWLRSVVEYVGELPFGRSALWLEFADVEIALGYRWLTSASMETRSRDELVQEQGRWVPCGYGKPNSGAWLELNDGANEILLSFRPKRQGSDGVMEVDLGADPDPYLED